MIGLLDRITVDTLTLKSLDLLKMEIYLNEHYLESKKRQRLFCQQTDDVKVKFREFVTGEPDKYVRGNPVFYLKMQPYIQYTLE